VLRVADTGVGVPAAELTRIFERFHRVPDARSRFSAGSGIGLALVREMTALHRGTITADSTEGTATRLTICLPLGAPARHRDGRPIWAEVSLTAATGPATGGKICPATSGRRSPVSPGSHCCGRPAAGRARSASRWSTRWAGWCCGSSPIRSG
jgi:Histidine kinase-, DNA gyrase B-, and HSP90-like ATPase